MYLPPFSLIHDSGKQNTCGNVFKISVSLTCYRHIGSKSTNLSPLAWCREGQKVTLVAVIVGFRSDLSITCKTDGNFGNVSAGFVFQSRVSTKMVVRSKNNVQKQQLSWRLYLWWEALFFLKMLNHSFTVLACSIVMLVLRSSLHALQQNRAQLRLYFY